MNACIHYIFLLLNTPIKIYKKIEYFRKRDIFNIVPVDSNSDCSKND